MLLLLLGTSGASARDSERRVTRGTSRASRAFIIFSYYYYIVTNASVLTPERQKERERENRRPRSGTTQKDTRRPVPR